METVLPKKPGRPATGRDPIITMRLPDDMIAQIERWTGKYDGMTRSTAIRCLIELGLHAPKAKTRRLSDPKDHGAVKGDTYRMPKQFRRKMEPKPKPPEPEPEPVPFKPRRRPRQLSQADIAAAVARAEAGSGKGRG